MVVMVALLRGVNVGGRGKLAMADLRAAASGLGHQQVRTYIQSGNLVFASTEPDPQAVGDELSGALGKAMGVAPAVAVRTHADLIAVVERNPFAERDVAHLHVAFATGTEDASVPLTDLEKYAPEEAVAVGRETFLYLPGGMGRSRLAADLGRKGLTGPGRDATVRNWRTVTKLLEMAEETAGLDGPVG